MKAIITLHPTSDSNLNDVIVVKGKRLAVNQADNNTLIVSEDGHVLGIYPNVRSLELKGKPQQIAQEQNGQPSRIETLLQGLLQQLSPASLATSVAEGIATAERLADEKSQARWAVESNPVATAHPDFDAFINSKMTSQDCAEFGIGVARTERDQYKARVIELEEALINIQSDVAADDLPQAMQDREMLYGRITALQNNLEAQRQTTTPDDSYTRGLYNGLILAESIMLDQEPCYMDPPAARSEAIVDPKAFEASPALGAGVEFEPLDESNTPTVDKGGLKKK